MNFDHNDKTKELIARVEKFMDDYVYPNEKVYEEQMAAFGDNRWQIPQILEDLKEKARAEGLWNLFLPESDRGAGLTNVEYAPLCEIFGRVGFAGEVFNCSAPDTGNMEVIDKYGNEEQKEQWLKPLLAGEMRSAYLMTEPDVASSDATNISTTIEKDGDEYVINGRKWWSSGGMDPHCKVAIVMGKTDLTAHRHQQQSMVLVPLDTPGLNIIRPLSVLGFYDSPEGHAEIELNNVRVPKENLILGEGRGFEIAQGRLGPGRIHHCMRLVGMAQYALELMSKRTLEREAFGKKFYDFSNIRQEVAISKCEIEQARLLTLSAADKMDKLGNKDAKDIIAMIKIVAPDMALKVIDRAIQILGGKGVGPDTHLAHYFAIARMLRLADGPDEVHMYQLGKSVIRSYGKL